MAMLHRWKQLECYFLGIFISVTRVFKNQVQCSQGHLDEHWINVRIHLSRVPFQKGISPTAPIVYPSEQMEKVRMPFSIFVSLTRVFTTKCNTATGTTTSIRCIAWIHLPFYPFQYVDKVRMPFPSIFVSPTRVFKIRFTINFSWNLSFPFSYAAYCM